MTTTAVARRGNASESTPYKCHCPYCDKFHYVDLVNWNLFGYDCVCMPCTDWNHVKFMQKNAVKFKMTCVKNCRCGFGK